MTNPHRLRQHREVDALLWKLASINSGVSPEAFERGHALISELGASWSAIVREAPDDDGIKVGAMTEWEAKYIAAHRSLTLAAIAQNEAEARRA